jgi:hypothetical protein
MKTLEREQLVLEREEIRSVTGGAVTGPATPAIDVPPWPVDPPPPHGGAGGGGRIIEVLVPKTF